VEVARFAGHAGERGEDVGQADHLGHHRAQAVGQQTGQAGFGLGVGLVPREGAQLQAVQTDGLEQQQVTVPSMFSAADSGRGRGGTALAVAGQQIAGMAHVFGHGRAGGLGIVGAQGLEDRLVVVRGGGGPAVDAGEELAGGVAGGGAEEPGQAR
jgi:hypothetical protein